jgi:hypothetical protein
VTYSKSISQFLPLAALPKEQCERHYVEVHFPFAQAALLELPHVVAYHTNRADRQLDIAGGWRQEPAAWRFVFLHFIAGAELAPSPELATTIEADHENCLRSLQRTSVREEVLVDHRCGQIQMAKYLVAVDRRSDEAIAALEQLTERLCDVVNKEFGGRLLIINHIVDESESRPGKEEGQRLTNRLLPETEKLAIFEMYFDDARWGDAAIHRAWLDQAFRGPNLDIRVFHVYERCGLDKRD